LRTARGSQMRSKQGAAQSIRRTYSLDAWRRGTQARPRTPGAPHAHIVQIAHRWRRVDTTCPKPSESADSQSESVLDVRRRLAIPTTHRSISADVIVRLRYFATNAIALEGFRKPSRAFFSKRTCTSTSMRHNWHILPTIDPAAIRAALSPRIAPTARAAELCPA